MFLHGLGARGNCFGAAQEHFDLDRFTLNFVDFPGFGDSPKPREFSYDMREIANWVVRALRSARIERFHLVAHSMGGIVGLLVAAHSDYLPISLILAEGNLLPEDAAMSRRIARRSEADFVTMYQRWLSQIPRFFASEPPQQRAELEESFRLALPVAVHRAATSSIAFCDSGTLSDTFESIECPRAHFVGAKGRPGRRWPVTANQSLVQRYVLGELGHFLMSDAAKFYTPLAQFIAKHSAATQVFMPR